MNTNCQDEQARYRYNDGICISRKERKITDYRQKIVDEKVKEERDRKRQ